MKDDKGLEARTTRFPKKNSRTSFTTEGCPNFKIV